MKTIDQITDDAIKRADAIIDRMDRILRNEPDLVKQAIVARESTVESKLKAFRRIVENYMPTSRKR